jgi:hypothetical protein
MPRKPTQPRPDDTRPAPERASPNVAPTVDDGSHRMGRDDGDYRPNEPGHHDEFPTGGIHRREREEERRKTSK